MHAFRITDSEHKKRVGNDHLFCKPPGKEKNSVGKAHRPALPGKHTVFYIAVTHYRSGYQLREKTQIRGKCGKAPLTPAVISVNIYCVACRLKGVKADSDGQSRLRYRIAEEKRQKKVRILEKEEYGKVCRKAEDQSDL